MTIRSTLKSLAAVRMAAFGAYEEICQVGRDIFFGIKGRLIEVICHPLLQHEDLGLALIRYQAAIPSAHLRPPWGAI